MYDDFTLMDNNIYTSLKTRSPYDNWLPCYYIYSWSVFGIDVNQPMWTLFVASSFVVIAPYPFASTRFALLVDIPDTANV